MTDRVVHEGCALEWLRERSLPPDTGVVTSLPNVDEFGHRDLDRWRTWFQEAAALVLQRTPPRGACVFFQTDIKHDGVWVDKSYLVQRAAEQVGAQLIWHKLALRAPPGTTTNHEPGFAHLLCFSQTLRADAANATPDVLERVGRKGWARSMGAEVADAAVGWLAAHAGARTIFAPFCGVGTALDAAEARGLASIGVERNPGRARRATRGHS